MAGPTGDGAAGRSRQNNRTQRKDAAMRGWPSRHTRHRIGLAAAFVAAVTACSAAPTSGQALPGPPEAPSRVGTAAPASSTGGVTATVPTPQHVVVVVLENKNIDQVL